MSETTLDPTCDATIDPATAPAPVGTLSVLNVGDGDLTISFDPGDPQEVVHGLRVLMDMQKRGYLIAVKLPDGSYVRAIEIDPTAGAYIVSLPRDASPALLAACGIEPGSPEALADAADAPKGKTRGRRGRLPIATSEAVGVARSAGG